MLVGNPVLRHNYSIEIKDYMIATETLYNLDYCDFDLYAEYIRELGLELVSFRAEDQTYVDLTVRGEMALIEKLDEKCCL